VTLLVPPFFARKTPLERFRERIEIGSSREDVEEVLGCSPGDYRTREYWPLMLGLGYWDYEEWAFNGCTILVQFSEQNRVAHFEVFDNIPRMDDPRSWWERIFGP